MRPSFRCAICILRNNTFKNTALCGHLRFYCNMQSFIVVICGFTAICSHLLFTAIRSHLLFTAICSHLLTAICNYLLFTAICNHLLLTAIRSHLLFTTVIFGLLQYAVICSLLQYAVICGSLQYLVICSCFQKYNFLTFITQFVKRKKENKNLHNPNTDLLKVFFVLNPD